MKIKTILNFHFNRNYRNEKRPAVIRYYFILSWHCSCLIDVIKFCRCHTIAYFRHVQRQKYMFQILGFSILGFWKTKGGKAECNFVYQVINLELSICICDIKQWVKGCCSQLFLHALPPSCLAPAGGPGQDKLSSLFVNWGNIDSERLGGRAKIDLLEYHNVDLMPAGRTLSIWGNVQSETH